MAQFQKKSQSIQPSARQRPLPRDTHVQVEKNLRHCQNLGLILDKFQLWQRVPEYINGGHWDLSIEIERRKRQNDGSTVWEPKTIKGGEAKGIWFLRPKGNDRIKDEQRDLLHLDTRINHEMLARYRERWIALVKDVLNQVKDGNLREAMKFRTISRLVIGLGGESTLETALTLHPLYGFPYLPGSAVKGIAHAAAFFELAELLGVPGLDNETFLSYKNSKTPFQLFQNLLEADDDKKQWREILEKLQTNTTVKERGGWILNKGVDDLLSHEKIKTFRDIFGWLGKAGEVVFFDAIPAEVPLLEVDIMNPHFPSYYRNPDKSAPHDGDSPQPVSFLTIKRGVSFLFAVTPRKKHAIGLQQARYWLKQGLETLGLGGKTASGYGFFKYIP